MGVSQKMALQKLMLRVVFSKSRSLSQPLLVASYHEKVIDHYEKPRNVGSLDKNSVNVGTGLVGAPACGDVMKPRFKLMKMEKLLMQNSRLLVVDQRLLLVL